MNRSDFAQRLLQRLRARGRQAVGLGIDLGTTKSCVAYAAYDPATDALRCECLRYARPDGSRHAAVPSAVAVDRSGGTLFGIDALDKRGQHGFLAERGLFCETKNEMGLRYTYSRAPEGFRNAGEVAARLLEHLRTGVIDEFGRDVEPPLVVTVPASFHGAQRTATVKAAETAFEFAAQEGDVRLLDEPYAAFLDLLWRAPDRTGPLLRDGGNVMVFDFGGGTCDVAIFRRDRDHGGTLGARLLGNSRYNRLGGGDIDRAIVHDVLIPALLRENGLEPWGVSWFEKRRRLEPLLLGVAEQLKIALGRRLASVGADASEGIEVAFEPLSFQAEIGGVGRRLALARPSLDALAFANLLKPFLDPEPAPEVGDEYVRRGSIFSPIVQALLRARLEREDIDGILLCGSSSLLPPVKRALTRQFPGAEIILHGAGEDLEGAIARGAALQSLAMQVLGEPLIAPVCGAEFGLRVTTGSVPLARAGDRVPAESSGPIQLRPPRDSFDAGEDIAVELLADERMVGRTLWPLPAPVSTSDRLALEWCMDENQCVVLSLSRGDEQFIHRFDAPITHLDMGNMVRMRMLERMEQVRESRVPRADLGRAFEQIARDAAQLGEYDKALHFVTLALQEQGDTAGLLNLRGIFREELGDKAGARDSYEQASGFHVARFNMALLEYRAGNYEQALPLIDAVIDARPERAYRVLRGDILDKLGRREQARAEWQDAIAGQPDWSGFDDFQLDWLDRAAHWLDQQQVRERIREQRERMAAQEIRMTSLGELPEFVDRELEDPAGMV